MILALMQPYFLPYIGYWQLINHVDTFVIYDDVNFIKQGYINRNTILSQGNAQYFTLETRGASSFKNICDINVGDNREKLLKTVSNNYSRAPHYSDVMPLIERIISNNEPVLSKYLGYSISSIADYLHLEADIIYSSDIKKSPDLKGKDRVINICQILGANTYVNSIGGQALYDREDFHRHGIQLQFLKSNLPEYRQFNHEFVSGLSILDVLMFNDRSSIIGYLEDFQLL